MYFVMISNDVKSSTSPGLKLLLYMGIFHSCKIKGKGLPSLLMYYPEGLFGQLKV